MIKNLIFDLDDTIIKAEKEDSIYYKEALRNCGYDEEKYYDIYVAIDEYDKQITEENMYYDKSQMLNTINKILNTNYEMNLIDEIFRVSGKYWTKRVIIKEEQIKELSEKYNLYVYSNYFTEVQCNRLESIGYLKYFKKIFCADKYGSKPFKKSLENILNEIGAKPQECIMIGDDKSRDILVANRLNIKSILYDYTGKKNLKQANVKDYIVISDFEEIFEYLKKIDE